MISHRIALSQDLMLDPNINQGGILCEQFARACEADGQIPIGELSVVVSMYETDPPLICFEISSETKEQTDE